MSNPTNTTTPGSTTPGLSLLVLPDLLTALQPEWSELPPPLPLFLREAQHGLTEALEVAECPLTPSSGLPKNALAPSVAAMTSSNGARVNVATVFYPMKGNGRTAPGESWLAGYP